MILSDRDILRNREDIKIVPFNRKNLGTNSYDLTLNPKMLVYVNAPLDPKVDNETKTITIPEEGLVLKAGELYIARTNEYTDTRKHVPQLAGKSSLARLGLFVHTTAGFGDDGFKGTWTLELYPTKDIVLYPNMKICQIYYTPITSRPLSTYDKKRDAKYLGQIDATASKYYKNYDELTEVN